MRHYQIVGFCKSQKLHTERGDIDCSTDQNKKKLNC